jgi:hypothetical protein
MGSTERADLITGEIEGTTAKLAKIIFIKCGNCRNRYDCMKQLINVEDTIQAMMADIYYTAQTHLPDEASFLTRQAAKMLPKACLSDACQSRGRPKRCAYLICASTNNQGKEGVVSGYLELLKTCDEEQRAQHIKRVMDIAGIEEGKLVKDAIVMLLACKVKKKWRGAMDEEGDVAEL